MSGVLRWEEPPTWTNGPRTEARIPWALIADQLRQRPGEWGVVYEGVARAPHVLVRIGQAGSPWFRPAGSFKTASRTRPDGGVVIYARYVGEGSGE